MGTHGGRMPTFWAQPALTGTHGGRRPTFWRPKADAGGSGGEAPRKKEHIEKTRQDATQKMISEEIVQEIKKYVKARIAKETWPMFRR